MNYKEGTQKSITADNQKFHYLQWEPETGARRGHILALHMFGGAPSDYTVFANSAIALGYSVTAMEFVGYGKTEWPEDMDFPTLWKLNNSLIVGVLENFAARGLKPCVVSASGSFAPTHAALRALKARRSSAANIPVAFVEPGIGLPDGIRQFIIKTIPLVALTYDSFEELLAYRDQQYREMSGGWIVNDEVKRAIVAGRVRRTAEGKYQYAIDTRLIAEMLRTARDFPDNLQKRHSEDQLNNPFLVLYGENSIQAREVQERAKALFGRSTGGLTLHAVKGGEHPLYLTTSQEIDPVLNFFEQAI